MFIIFCKYCYALGILETSNERVRLCINAMFCDRFFWIIDRCFLVIFRQNSYRYIQEFILFSYSKWKMKFWAYFHIQSEKWSFEEIWIRKSKNILQNWAKNAILRGFVQKQLSRYSCTIKNELRIPKSNLELGFLQAVILQLVIFNQKLMQIKGL